MTEGGLFSRWAKRKRDVAAANADEVAHLAQAVPAAAPVAPTGQASNAVENAAGNATSSAEARPLPTIDSLTADSDFAPFMAKDVAPDMRNQAMKKLFTDPHYNVMDGLDIYIDDYGKPDPLPEGWLQLMNQSKTLRLFETAEEEAARLGLDAAAPQDASIAATAQSDDTAALDAVASTPSEQLPAEQLPTASSPVNSEELSSLDIHASPTSESKLT